MLKSFIIIIIFSFYAVLPALSFAQDSNTELRKAIKLYDSSNYEAALKLFQKISVSAQDTSEKIFTLLFKGKTLLKLKNYEDSRKILHILISQYPKNEYIDEARLTLAKNYFEDNEFYQAFDKILKLINSSDSEYYLKYGKSLGEKIALGCLTSRQLDEFNNSSNNEEPYLLLIQSKVMINEGDYPSAQERLWKIITQFPQADEASESLSIYNRIKDKKFTPPVSIIGIVLPLGGEKVPAFASSAAKEILEGIKFAVSNYNDSNPKIRIGIIVRNTKFDENKIDSIKNEFKNINSLMAVIGPIFSDEVRITLEKFKDTNIPIISPTATDADLTSINKNFFQANPPFFVRGTIMADYVYLEENKKRMAVLNAEEGYSSLLANNFSEEFENLGGQIFFKETYKSNTFNLDEPVDSILAIKDTLQGIYLPLADKADAPVLLSQLIQDSIIVSLYGNQDWLYAEGFETSSALSSRLIFSCDNFINYSDPNYEAFNKKFYERTKTDAGRNVLYGYDTANYLLTIMENSKNTRYAIKNKMESGMMVKGFHNNISFDADHINKFLNIVSFKNDKFELVERYSSAN